MGIGGIEFLADAARPRDQNFDIGFGKFVQTGKQGALVVATVDNHAGCRSHFAPHRKNPGLRRLGELPLPTTGSASQAIPMAGANRGSSAEVAIETTTCLLTCGNMPQCYRVPDPACPAMPCLVGKIGRSWNVW